MNKLRPRITVAKEDCVKPVQYDAPGEKGLHAWAENV